MAPIGGQQLTRLSTIGRQAHRATTPLRTFVEGYRHLGYVPCDGGEFEDGFTKIAIYATQGGSPTHVARQLEDGAWTSKLGDDHDIRHGSAEDLQAGRYGYVRLFLRRPNRQGS